MASLSLALWPGRWVRGKEEQWKGTEREETQETQTAGKKSSLTKRQAVCPCPALSHDFTQKPLYFDQLPTGPRICSWD